MRKKQPVPLSFSVPLSFFLFALCIMEHLAIRLASDEKGSQTIEVESY